MKIKIHINKKKFSILSQWITLKNLTKCHYCFVSAKSNKNTLVLRINLLLVDVRNVSLNPNDNPWTIRKDSQRKVRCVVNSSAFPPPTITWYLGPTNITYMAGTDTTSITITGNRADNTKTLQCRATNNNTPPKTASTTLNVECKYNDFLIIYTTLRWR